MLRVCDLNIKKMANFNKAIDLILKNEGGNQADNTNDNTEEEDFQRIAGTCFLQLKRLEFCHLY